MGTKYRVGYILVVALLAVSALFVCVEMAVFSVRAERLGIAADKGDRRGDLVLGFLGDPPRFLSAFQIATTLTSILIGAYGQSMIAAQWSDRLEAMGLMNPQSWAFWLTVASTTFLTLILANLVPKQVGFVWAEEVALATARVSDTYVRLTRPLAWILEAISRGIARLFRIPIASTGKVTEADVVFMMKGSRHVVELEPSERAIAEQAFRLSDLQVVDSMTPRSSIEWIDRNWPIQRIRAFVIESGRSFLLVCNGELDKVEGTVKARDFLGLDKDEMNHQGLRQLVQEALVLPRSARLLNVVEKMKSSDARVAIVADEHGAVVGLITLNDLISALVGPLCGIK